MKKVLLAAILMLLSYNSFGQIDAVTDSGIPVNGLVGGVSIPNVLINDTLNGNPVDFSTINLTMVSTTNPGLTLNLANGSVFVSAGTPAGNYTLTYQICEIGNPTNCDTVIVTVPVFAPIIDAVDNVGSMNSSGGIAYSNVLDNDTLNGVPVLPFQINVTSVVGSLGVSLSGTSIIVDPGTPAGIYTVVYQICEILNPTNCDTAVVTITVIDQSLTLLKDGVYVDSALPSGYSVGDQINYAFTINNNTAGALSNVFVTDANAVVTGSPISLAAGQSSNTAFTATHTITQIDLDAGQVVNTATVTATPTSGPVITVVSQDPTPCTICVPVFPNCNTCTITPLVQNPSVNVLMDGVFVDANSNGFAEVGEVIIYTLVVTNTGNVTLSNLTVSSPNAIVSGGPIPVLPVGASDSTTFTATHVITQLDIDSGQVDAIAIATGTPPIGSINVSDASSDPTPCGACTPLNPSCTSCTIVELEIQPIHTLSITGMYSDYNNDGFTNVGDVINYSYTIVNTNPTNPITNLTLSGSNVTVLGGTLASLAPASTDTTTFTAVYLLTQADINAGLVTTSAVADGFILGLPVTATASSTLNLNLSSGIKLNAFFDTNGNGIQNPGEPNVNVTQGNFYYQINSGVTHTVTSPNGMVTLYEGNPTSDYTIGFTINPSYASQYTVSPSSYSNVTVATGSGITTYIFPVSQIPFNDLAVYLSSSGGPRPGFAYSSYIIFKNQGNQTITSGTITFTVNTVVTISAYPSGAVPTATGFTYDFTNLLPNEQRLFYFTMQVPTIPTVSIGQLLTNSVSITIPSGDVNTFNNSATLTQDIRASYDPNDKQEHHGGQIEFDTFTSDDYLTYTIRFENTGNANAVNVSVEDVLDQQLDETSIRMVDASHNYVLDRVGSNLTWRFDGIDLPPSVPDTQIGHGYIIFQIKPKTGFAIGDIIPNFAEIYFDFNPAIVTNTHTTEFVETLGNSSFIFAKLNYFPNPVKNSLTISNDTPIESVAISSILGQQILSQKVNSLETEINLSTLSNGIYFVKVVCYGAEKTIKVIKE